MSNVEPGNAVITGGPAAQSFLEGGMHQPTTAEIRAQQQAIFAAQQPAPPQQQQANQGRLFSEEEVAQFRQDEKAKVYPRLDELKAQLDALKAERDAERQAVTDAEAAKVAAEEAAANEKLTLTAKFTKMETETQAQFAALRAEADTSRALLDQERRFQVLQEYRNQQLAVNQNAIIPQLFDYIGGNSEEEIDRSIQDAIARSQGIATEVAQYRQVSMMQAPTTRITAPPTGPLEDQSSQQQLSSDQIKNMSAADYARNRHLLLPATGRQFRQG